MILLHCISSSDKLVRPFKDDWYHSLPYELRQGVSINEFVAFRREFLLLTKTCKMFDWCWDQSEFKKKERGVESLEEGSTCPSLESHFKWHRK